MYGENQVCFLCESNGNIKRCVCDSFFKLIDNIQQPESQQIYRRPLKPLDLSYKDVYNLDCKGASTMCISLDGKWIVSGFIVPTREATKAPKSVVEVWSVESNSKYATLYGHRMYIHSLCMSADNRWIVSSARDQTMRIWSMEEKSQVAGLRGHTGDVNSVCISRDSRWIVSCSRDETIRVWSTKTMSEEAVFTGHEASVESVCLSVDSRIIVSGSEDCSLRVWSMKSKSEVAVLRGHTDVVNSVCISNNSIWIASGSRDKTVRVWNMLCNNQEAVFQAIHKVGAVCISPDSKLILSSRADQNVNVWSIEKKIQVAVLAGDEGDLSDVTVGQDSIWILSRARWIPSPDRPSNPFHPILNSQQYRTFMTARRVLIVPPRSNGENLRVSNLKY